MMLHLFLHTLVLCIALSFSSFASVTAQPLSKDHDQHEIQSGPRAPDVFLLGLPHSGTEALLRTLSALGYRYKDPSDDEVTHFTSLDVTKAESLQHPYAEVFFGIPWSLTYADLAPLFPEAKFILTVRKSEDDWLKHLKHDNDGEETFREQMSEAAYRDEYRRHADAVRTFFTSARPRDGQFMELVVYGDKALRGNQLRQLCHFLDIDCGTATSAYGLGGMELRRRLDALRRGLFEGGTLRIWFEAVLLETLNFVAWLTAQNL